MAQLKPKTLVLGLGNDLLTDDAIGMRVTAKLRERLQASESIQVLQTSEMGLSLLDLVVDFENLVVIDAIQTMTAPPGFVHEFEGNDLKLLPEASPHALGLAEVLAFGRKLHLRVPHQVRIFAVEVQDPYTIAFHMTPQLESSLDRIVEQIASRLSFAPR